MSDKLEDACRGLISYWKRNRFNWQLEKAEDFLKDIEKALEAGYVPTSNVSQESEE